jgi:hypothetical protein
MRGPGFNQENIKRKKKKKEWVLCINLTITGDFYWHVSPDIPLQSRV